MWCDVVRCGAMRCGVHHTLSREKMSVAFFASCYGNGAFACTEVTCSSEKHTREHARKQEPRGSARRQDAARKRLWRASSSASNASLRLPGKRVGEGELSSALPGQ